MYKYITKPLQEYLSVALTIYPNNKNSPDTMSILLRCELPV